MTDNGAYVAYPYYPAVMRFCWILFVMDIGKHNSGAIEENTPVQMFEHPAASLMVRPIINATTFYFLNGLNSTEMGLFWEEDGMILIPSVRREMHLQNVTYRAIKDTGEATEVNYTLKVLFGPTWPLALTPEKTQYFLGKGKTVPDITCSNECNPACTVSWGEHSQSNTLHLGEVTADSTGKYICTALRNGSSFVVKTSILVYVSDYADTTFVTIAIPILISVQVMTTIVLGVCALFSTSETSHRLTSRYAVTKCNKTFPSITEMHSSAYKHEQNFPRSPAATDDSNRATEDRNITATEFDKYEELRRKVKNAPTPSDYEKIRNEGNSNNIGVEMYENTRLSSSSSHVVID